MELVKKKEFKKEKIILKRAELACQKNGWNEKLVALGFITHFAWLKVEQTLGATNVCAQTDTILKMMVLVHGHKLANQRMKLRVWSFPNLHLVTWLQILENTNSVMELQIGVNGWFWN